MTPARDAPMMRALLLLSLTFLSATPLSAAPGAVQAAIGPTDDPPEPLRVGIEAGAFYLQNFHPTEGVRQKIAFTLHIDAPSERAEEYRQLLASLEGRFRDEVITAVRSCDLEVFQEPSLSRLSRTIHARLRRTLPQLAIDGVYFTDFEYTEE